MFFCTPRNASLVLVAALATFALTIDLASGRGGSRGGRVGGHASSAAVQGTPARDQQGTSMRDPPGAAQLSTAGVNLLSFIQSASPRVPPAPAATPTSAIVAPAGELQGVAPLSQPVATTFVGTGASSTAASPYFSSSTPTIPGEGEGAAPTSPSLAAPSTPGGGGGTLDDCMRFWDRAAHEQGRVARRMPALYAPPGRRGAGARTEA
jgi:hypothetical protein